MIINQIWISDDPTPSAVVEQAKKNEIAALSAGFKYQFWEKSNFLKILSKADINRMEAMKNDVAKCDFARYLALKKNKGIYIDMDDWMHFTKKHKEEYFISRLQGGEGFIVNGILHIPEEVIDCVLKKARAFIDRRGLGDARAVGIAPLRHCINEIKFKHRYIKMGGGKWGDSAEMCSPGKVWGKPRGKASWKDHINLWEEPKTLLEELS